MVAQRDDHSFPANSTSYLPFSVYSVASLNMLAASKAKSTNAYVEAMQFTDFGNFSILFEFFSSFANRIKKESNCWK